MKEQKYFIHIAFEGTDFHGWQIQQNADTVQEVLQNGLSKVLRQDVEVCGAGRTDAGVHARKMIAHFVLPEEIKDVEYLSHQLNSILPSSIAVENIVRVKEDAHARFDALSRTYEYHINFMKSPFLVNKSYYFNRKLNFDLMNEAAQNLLKFQDFTSFSKLHTETKTNNCKVVYAKWEVDQKQAIFTITADRFLRNMVRAIVGTLLEVGLGKIEVSDVDKIIEAKDRSEAGYSVPAHGLYLTEIKYPEAIYE